MTNVVYVLPVVTENALRYLRGVARLPEVRLGVISQRPAAAFPQTLQRRMLAHRQVRNPLDADELTLAVADLSKRLGPVHRVFGMIEQIQEQLAEVRSRLEIPGMLPDVARNFRDKDRMKAVLREAGLPVARSRRVDGPGDIRALVDEVGLPIVVKPLQGAGSRSTFRVETKEQLAEALRIPASPARPWQAEEFVRGEENTMETVVVDGRPVWWSGTRYLPGPLTVLENPWIQYTVLLPAEVDEPDFVRFRDLNFAALRALGIRTGLTHMEWFKRPDGSMVVSEVAARPPGVHIMPLMSYAHAHDMISAWCELMVRGTFASPRRTSAAGAAFFRGQGEGDRVVSIRGLRQAQEEVGQYVVERQLPRIGQPRAPGYEGEGWAIVNHPQTRVAAHALERLVGLVRVELG